MPDILGRKRDIKKRMKTRGEREREIILISFKWLDWIIKSICVSGPDYDDDAGKSFIDYNIIEEFSFEREKKKENYLFKRRSA